MATVFWLSAGLLAWTYIFFPATLLLRAALRTRPLHPPLPDGGEPRVTVVVAVRNEANRLEARISNLLSQEYPSDRLDVLIACNACTDATEGVAYRIAAASNRVTVVVGPSDEGKAGALNLGTGVATGEIVVFADARQRFAADAVRRLVEPFFDPAVGAVSGRLVIGEGDAAAVQGVGLYWSLESRLRLAQSLTGSVVGATGAIYAIRRALFAPLPPHLILDDVYTPIRIALRGHRVLLRPEAVAFDSASPRTGAEYVRKLRTMTGNLQLLRVLPQLARPWENPIWGRYVSHKLLRVLSPLFLLSVIATGALLPSWPFGAVAAATVAFLLVGAVGLWLPFRALALPAAFVVVQCAALHALLRPSRDARTVWNAESAQAEQQPRGGDPAGSPLLSERSQHSGTVTLRSG